MPTRKTSANNGRVSKDPRLKWLDKALSGKSPEIKARVLELILSMNIDPENEFFVIFVALGQLQVLIEDSPLSWQHLFENFQKELGEWATTNVETLSHLADKTEMISRLAQSSERLGDILNGLVQVCNGLIAQLQESNLLLTKSIAQLTDSNTNSLSLAHQTRQEVLESKQLLLPLIRNVEALNSQVSNLSVRLSYLKNQSPSQNLERSQNLYQSYSQPRSFAEWKEKIQRDLLTWEGSAFWGAVCAFFFWSIVFCGATIFYLQDRRILLETGTKMQWLLEKANRRDCREGILKPDSPECQKYFPPKDEIPTLSWEEEKQ